MTFLKPWLLPTLACSLVLFSNPAAVAQQVMHPGATTAAESAELEAYRLTIGDVHKYYAVQLALARLVRTHPELAEEVGAGHCDDLSVPEVTCQAQHKEDSPHAREALRAAGLTSRQFVVISDVFTEANNYDSAVMCFGDATCAAALAREAERYHITANVAVVHQLRAELQRLQGEVDAITNESSESPAAVAQGITAATKADSTELQAYRLTIEDVRKYYAVMLAGMRLARTHPELAKADTADLSLAPLTARGRQIEEHPQGREVLRAGGLTGRQFIVIELVLTGAGLARLGGDQSVLINPANVAFINEHQAELQRLQGELMAALPDSLRAPVMSLPAEGVRETVHLVVTGGPNAGTYDAQTSEGGCSYGFAGQGSWGNQLSSTDPDPRKFNSLQLIVPNATVAAAASKPFLISVGFGPVLHRSAEYTVDTRTENNRSPSGSGTVAIDDRGNTGTVTFSVQTSAGVKLEGKIECRSVMRTGSD